MTLFNINKAISDSNKLKAINFTSLNYQIDLIRHVLNARDE